MNVHDISVKFYDMNTGKTRPVDPSSYMGAKHQALALRLYWLAEGWDIPVAVRKIISIDKGRTRDNRGAVFKDCRESVFSPRLLWDQRKRVTREQAMDVAAGLSLDNIDCED